MSLKNLSHIFPKSSVVDFRSPSIEFNAFSSSAILNVDEKGFFYLLSCNTLFAWLIESPSFTSSVLKAPLKSSRILNNFRTFAANRGMKYYFRFTIGSKCITAGTITWPVQSAMTMEEIVFKASFVQQLLFLEVALRLKVDGTLTVALT